MAAFDKFVGAGEPGPKAVADFIETYINEHGATVKKDLIKATEQEWERAAGRPFEKKAAYKVKKALATLAKEHRVVSLPAKGYYGPISEAAVQEAATHELEIEIEEDEDLIEELVEDEAADFDLGTGKEYVYAFHIDAYKKIAILMDKDRWPMKIGRSQDLDTRMKTHSTALPDAPTVAVVLRTDNAKDLEKAIHSMLKAQGREYDGDGGSEWYETTPDEIVEIYRFVTRS